MRTALSIDRRLVMLQTLRRRGDLLRCLRMGAFAAVVPLLARLQVPTLAKVLQPRPGPAPADPAETEQVLRCLESAFQLAGPLLTRSCLTRSLTLFYFLRRAGMELDLCFGAGLVDGESTAHCWLVRDGEPYLEETDPRPYFVEMVRIRCAD